MKNFAKFLGIIAAVAVIGLSFAACGGDDDDKGGGGSISWAGTWQKEGANDSFTLGAKGTGWAFDGDPVSTANGEKWKTDNDYLGFGRALLFQDTTLGTLTTVAWYYYDRISSTKIRITRGGNMDSSRNGVWEKK